LKELAKTIFRQFKKIKKKDLNDLKKYVSSYYELITTQQEYLRLFYSKLEEQKCKCGINPHVKKIINFLEKNLLFK